MCQTALVLPRLPSLQRLQAVGATTVGRVFPFLAEVHAVLPHVVACEENTRLKCHHKTLPAAMFSTGLMNVKNVYRVETAFMVCLVF